MKRIIVIFALLLAVVPAGAQYVSSGFSLSRPDFVSSRHPGKLVVDYDRLYLDGKALKDYEAYNALPPETYDVYVTGKTLYNVSQGIAIGSMAAVLAGGVLSALSRTQPGASASKAGPWLAGCGAVGLFAVAIPLDYVGQARIRKAARIYNQRRQQ